MDIKQYKTLKVSLGDIPAYIFTLKVRDLQYISYIAVRGKDNEPGAVQRVLSPVRLHSIEGYILKGNTFYTPFVLNWTFQEESPTEDNGIISVPLINRAAQVLDGQHRLAGFARAIEKKKDIEDIEVIVILATKLDTKEAASIFLNINTEQKPVPKSLIYDLFGEIHENDKDLPLVRANDIAEVLQTDKNSPYRTLIKKPGMPRGAGLVDLSTVINSLKPLLEEEGVFSKYNVETLENQCSVIINYFNAIKEGYGNDWYSKARNPFLANAGFGAAITVLAETLMAKCAEQRDFTQNKMENLLHLPKDSLLEKADIKNYEGKTQRKLIAKFLEDSINKDIPEEDAYKF